MDIQEIMQERQRDRQNELEATMRECKANHDAQEHPEYFKSDDCDAVLDGKYNKELLFIEDNVNMEQSHGGNDTGTTDAVLPHFAAELAGLPQDDVKKLLAVFSWRDGETIKEAVKVLYMAAQRACERLAEERTF